MKQEDPFDLDKLRASPEIVEARQKVAEKLAAKPSKRQKDAIFIRLPMPWDRLLWESKCRFTSRVLNYLIERQFKQRAKSQPIPVSNVEMERRNVSRVNKERALRELEAFGICTVERRGKRCPRVTLLSKGMY